MKSEKPIQVQIERLKLKTFNVKIKAIKGSGLITHRLNPDTVKNKITNREAGKKSKKKLRNFDEEYKSCFHKTTSKKYGYPASAFQACILDACVVAGIAKTTVRRAVRIMGDIIPLKYKKIVHRVDFPRRSGITRAPDERHRPEFMDWEAELIIRYDENQITPEQIINLLNIGGFSCGVGDWRPNKSGNHGMFEVVIK